MQATPIARMTVSAVRCRRQNAAAAAASTAARVVLDSVAHPPRRIPTSIPAENPAKYLSPYTRLSAFSQPYFDLSAFNDMLDIHPNLTQTSTSSDGSMRIRVTNDAPQYVYEDASGSRQTMKRFGVDQETMAMLQAASQETSGAENADPAAALAKNAANAFSLPQLKEMHKYQLVAHRVVNMTSKGKQPSQYVLVVVGDGNGLIGYGEGKGDSIPAAAGKAFVQAVKGMDYIQRKDSRTTWSGLMTGKWGATTVELRSRPPGFGLRCSPLIHQVAKAAGILDLSAKVRGSRNGMNTVKATINLLHGGAAPLGLGDISGTGKLARRFKGVGMRTSQEIGLDLGRKPIEMR